ncbi:hypothetical protein PGS49_06150 [Yersinia intermedia]|uniref:hypothetical protein n=1 Tax=Yersinia intermedia TaxID=631 RepID=UPI0022FE1469|nr:hypothetical protein [Yersinia intermedia]MDA5480240.1 hypothetical protein [Yersinia intermedia]
MRKIKWILLNTDFSLEEIVKYLSSDSFTEKKGRGFTFNKIRKSYLHGRFIEKLMLEDKIPTLYGDDTTIQRVEYRIVDFEIEGAHLPIISITNPPRTLKPFSNSLVKNLGLGISIEEININLFQWCEVIEENLSLKINKIEASQIKVAEFALAKMQISSSQDLKKYYCDNLENKNPKIDRLSCEIMTPYFGGRIKLYKNGMAQIETKNDRELSNILFESMMRIVSFKDD